MAKYSYIAINTDGKQIKGTLDASSQQDANAQLNAKGLMPTKVVLSEQVRLSQPRHRLKNEKSVGLWSRDKIRGAVYIYTSARDFDSGGSSAAEGIGGDDSTGEKFAI